MRKDIVVLSALVILLSAASSAFSAQVWTEQKITTTGTWSRTAPLIWGGEVYYNDNRSGHYQIYVWDQAGGERLFLGGTGSTYTGGGVYGNDLLVGHRVNGQYSLSLYDPVNGERLLSATAGPAAIYGNTVVWSDTRSGVSQIYTWDPVNGERHIAPSTHAQTNPRIWGSTVAWEEASDTGFPYDKGVNMWNPTDGRTFLGWYNSPAISQSGIYMFQPYDWQHPSYGGGIWKWTSAAGAGRVYSEQNSSWQGCYYPQAWGDMYVFGGGRHGPGIPSMGLPRRASPQPWRPAARPSTGTKWRGRTATTSTLTRLPLSLAACAHWFWG